MSPAQMLRRVELPLAAPKILSGLRTATVLVVGTATLVTTVGGASLGNYIFEGLEGFNDLRTVFGCVLAALLAVCWTSWSICWNWRPSGAAGDLAWAGVAGLLLTCSRRSVLSRPRHAGYARGSGRCRG